MSWTILNSLFSDNRAIGNGANPPKDGTPGGGNGGAIYNDGNEMTLRVEGTLIEDNRSQHEGGSAVFFVSNNRTGSITIKDSIMRNNDGDGFQTYPGIFFLGDADHVHELDGRIGRQAAAPGLPAGGPTAGTGEAVSDLWVGARKRQTANRADALRPGWTLLTRQRDLGGSRGGLAQ